MHVYIHLICGSLAIYQFHRVLLTLLKNIKKEKRRHLSFPLNYLVPSFYQQIILPSSFKKCKIFTFEGMERLEEKVSKN